MEKPKLTDYTIPPPALPWAAYALGLVVGVGLVALFMAAYHAFNQVMDNPVQAAFSAALIEASAIVEAFTLARARRLGDYALAGAATVVSLLVSGIYNFVQVQAVGAVKGVTAMWQLWPLALGPLVALAFLALNLGRALREHEDAARAWQQSRQKWFDNACREWDTAERKRQAERDAREAAERERQAKREAAERVKIEEIRAAAVGSANSATSANGSVNGTAKLTFGSKAEFMAFMQSANGEAPKSGSELVKLCSKPSERTLWRWWSEWQELKPKAQHK